MAGLLEVELGLGRDVYQVVATAIGLDLRLDNSQLLRDGREARIDKLLRLLISPVLQVGGVDVVEVDQRADKILTLLNDRGAVNHVEDGCIFRSKGHRQVQGNRLAHASRVGEGHRQRLLQHGNRIARVAQLHHTPGKRQSIGQPVDSPVAEHHPVAVGGVSLGLEVELTPLQRLELDLERRLDGPQVDRIEHKLDRRIAIERRGAHERFPRIRLVQPQRFDYGGYLVFRAEHLDFVVDIVFVGRQTQTLQQHVAVVALVVLNIDGRGHLVERGLPEAVEERYRSQHHHTGDKPFPVRKALQQKTRDVERLLRVLLLCILLLIFFHSRYFEILQAVIIKLAIVSKIDVALNMSEVVGGTTTAELAFDLLGSTYNTSFCCK